jgi:tellurite resistance protein
MVFLIQNALVFSSMTTAAPQRIPLNTLAIPLGLTGLAEVWGEAAKTLGTPAGVAEVFWIIAAVALIWIIAAHAWRGARSADRLSTQLVHPAQGPIAALVPIVGMLLGGNLYGFWAVGGLVLTVASLVAAAAFTGWILSVWMRGELKLESVHGGYFLPTVAASFVSAGTAAEVGLRPLAIGAFAVGTFFWAIMFTVLLARLAFRPALPAPLVPSLAIMIAPPAVAGAAWFVIDGGRVDTSLYGLAALTVSMLLLQFALVPRYLKLAFSLGFWSFSFPFAYVGAFGIIWLGLLRTPGWQAIIVAIVAGVSVLIVAIAVQSLRSMVHDRRAKSRAAEEQLWRADDEVANADGSRPSSRVR